ncbi:UNVERIFIED_CONTAM: hypothetical protein HDU68_000725, partial [Siphonaria sp. JEL0065]
FANKVYTTPEAEAFLVEIVESSPAMRLPSSWTSTDPIPVVPLHYHDFSDEVALDEWLNVRLDKVENGRVVHGKWWHHEKIQERVETLEDP